MKLTEIKEESLNRFKRTLIKCYLASPPKIQYALAKYGVKVILHKKKSELEELIRH